MNYRNRFFSVFAMALLLLFIAACGETQSEQTCVGAQNNCNINNYSTSSGDQNVAPPTPTDVPTPTPTPTMEPTPTDTPTPSPAPAGTLLCKGQWSTGQNSWRGNTWKTLNGALLNDGSNDGPIFGPSLVAPCDLSNQPDFKLEVKIQVQNIIHFYPGFGFFVRYNGDTNDGYIIGPTSNRDNVDRFIVGYATPQGYNYPQKTQNFAPSSGVDTYVVVVKGNDIKVFVDGGFVVDLVDNKSLNGGSLGFWDRGVQITISSVIVTAL